MFKSRLFLVLLLILAGTCLVWLLGPAAVFGYHTGAPSGYSSSTADARSCATPGCHSGPPSLVEGWIVSDVPASGYLPGHTYTLTVTASRQGVSKYGFQVSPVDSLNNFGGTFSLADPVNTQLGTGYHYVTHTAAGNSGNGSRTWTLYWEAPSIYPLWPVTIYGAFVAGDSLGNDSVYHSRLRIVPENLGFSEPDKQVCMRIFRTGNEGNMWIGQDGEMEISLYDIAGRMLWSGKRTGSENPVSFPADVRGLVLIVLSSDGIRCSQVSLL